MSFPKAKLQRFNDIKTCSPSPALYSPSIKSTTAVTSKTAKPEIKSPIVVDAVSLFSANSTPCFRTPTTIPKKRKVLGFMRKSKPVELFKQTADTNEALKEKIVECSNKDQSIRELMEQMEEMQLELANRDIESRFCAQENLKELSAEMERLKSQLIKEEDESARMKTQLRNLEEENCKIKSELQEFEVDNTYMKTQLKKFEVDSRLHEEERLEWEEERVQWEKENLKLEEDILQLKKMQIRWEEGKSKMTDMELKWENERSKWEIQAANWEIERSNWETERSNWEKGQIKQEKEELIREEEQFKQDEEQLKWEAEKCKWEAEKFKWKTEKANYEQSLQEINHSKLTKEILTLKEEKTQLKEEQIKLKHEQSKLREEYSKFKEDKLKLNEDKSKFKEGVFEFNDNFSKLHKTLPIDAQSSSHCVSSQCVEDKIKCEEIKLKLDEVQVKLKEQTIKLEEGQLHWEDEKTELKKEHIITMHKLTIKHNCELQKLLRKIHDLNMELKNVRHEHANFSHQNEQDIKRLAENMLLFESLYNKSVEDFNEEIRLREVVVQNNFNKLKKAEAKIEHLIKSHAAQIQELISDHGNKIKQLQKQVIDKEESLEERNEIICGLEKRLEDLEIASREEIQKHQEEIQRHQEELQKLQEELQKHQEELQKLDKDFKINQDKLETPQEESKKHLEDTVKSQKEMEILKKDMEKLREDYENLKIENREKVVDVEYDMIKCVAEVQGLLDKENARSANLEVLLKNKGNELSDFKQKYKEAENLMNDAVNKLKQIEEDYRDGNVLSEIQMNERLRDLEITWLEKLDSQEKEAAAILKECQAISEYSIIQTELEKNQIRKELEDVRADMEILSLNSQRFREAYDCLQDRYRELQSELSKVQINLEEARKQACEESANYKKYVDETLSEKRTYNVTLNTTLSTIETLKNRLMNSDRDVEQLKKELEFCELDKLEYEGKCNQLMDEVVLVSKLNEDLELQHETTLAVMESQVLNIQRTLLESLDTYKMSAYQKISELKVRLDDKEKSLQAIMDHLHDQQKVNCNAQVVITSANNELERLEGFSTDYKFRNSRLETTLNKLTMELNATHQEIHELKESKSGMEMKLCKEIEDNTKLTNELIEAKNKAQDYDGLLKKVEYLQEQYDSYFNYCEYYKTKASEYEVEIEEMGKINKKYIETCGKYDQLLQDYEQVCKAKTEVEQKVKELEKVVAPFMEQLDSSEKEQQLDLKKTNFELIEENRSMSTQVKSLGKTVEKLKKELSLLTGSPKKLKHHPSCDKENINSPNRSLNHTLTESPGPLRDRN